MKAVMVFVLCAVAAAAQGPAFEVASVKLLNTNVYRANIAISGNRVTASGPVEHLIELAYGVKAFQVVGGPAWIRSGDAVYEILAKVEGDAAPARPQARAMLQNLLAERFHLTVHREEREIPVYSLVAAKDGVKLKKSAPDAETGSTFNMGPNSRIVATETMASLASQLELDVDMPVLDKTGLTGPYEVKLEWSAEEPVFTALAGVGLKLEASRQPFPVLAIERVERPTDN